jgi:DNA-binding XRE family transcriptional regulator
MFEHEDTFSIQLTASCPSCQLIQYATASGHSVAGTRCRRCGQPLGILYYRFKTTPQTGNLPPDRSSIRESIGAFIRRLRARRHISQGALARHIGVHRTAITRAEGGQISNMALLFRTASAMDLEIDQIIIRIRDRWPNVDSRSRSND